MSELVVYDEIRRELETAESVDVLTEAKARIDAATTYARRKQLIPALMDGLELKLRCERRLGEVLSGVVTRGYKSLPEDIDRMQSSRWQRLASVDPDDFEQYIAHKRENEDEPTTAGALRLANGHKPEPEYTLCPTCGHRLRADKPRPVRRDQ